MAEIVSVCLAFFQCLQPSCKSLAARKNYISKFDDNLKEFREVLASLEAKKSDLEREVNDGEIKGQRRKDEVARWLSKFETIKTKTDKLDADASAVEKMRSSSGCCSWHIISTYRCGKKIPKMLSEVKNFDSEKVSKVVTRQATIPVYEEKSDQKTVGLATKLDSTWSVLMEDATRILGLYGMGGVGKTTLLKLIYKRFGEVKDMFDVIIWVEDVDIGKIQDEIAKRVGLYNEEWRTDTEREKSVKIGRVLKDFKPRFVLLLDNLWKKVSLKKIGIPLHEKKEYKIVFSSPSEDVCRGMKAKENIKVEPLAKEDALDLLMQISGRDALTGEILGLAEEIVKKCGGLPLALKVIGKCLSSEATEDKWRGVRDDLVHYPDQVEGMDKMFGVLKVSYDRLEDDAKLCFQYCALFPMAYNINQDELVEYWIGERLIEVRHGRDKAKKRGAQIIRTLVGAGLLLKVDESKQKVYMHNTIRDMALWIVSEIRDGKKFLVETDAGLETLPPVTDWTIVSKMSLMNNEIASIADSPLFPNPDGLVTLFLQNNKLVNIVGKFFQVISTLVVLDLSHNSGIMELPNDISKLVFLRYLNMLGTTIKNLQGIQELSELIHLDLESTSNLRDIRWISGLLKLQVLKFYESNASLDLPLLEHLKGLRFLELLTITVRKGDVLEAFLRCNILADRTRGIYLEGLKVSGASFAATLGKLSSLSKLGLTDCDITESETELEENRNNQCSSSSLSNQITPRTTWFKKLSAVVLLSCEHLMDVTWLIYAENLESLSVKSSHKMKEVISQKKAGDVGVEPFQKLQVLELGFLGELESIYWTSLGFPKLQTVRITECAKLRKLPLNSTSVENIDDLRMEVEEAWLKRVEWESGAEERFGPAIGPVSDS